MTSDIPTLINNFITNIYVELPAIKNIPNKDTVEAFYTNFVMNLDQELMAEVVDYMMVYNLAMLHEDMLAEKLDAAAKIFIIIMFNRSPKLYK